MPSGNVLFEQLETIFRAQREKADSIIEILEQERQALLAGDLSELDTAAQAKTDLLDDLDALRLEEVEALQGEGLDFHLVSEPRPPEQTEKLRATQRDAIDSIARCQAMNSRNGLLLQHRIGYVQRALQALGGGDGNAGTYGSDGRIEPQTRLRCVARG